MAAEGRTTWLAIAALLAAILGFDGWLVLARPSPGKIPGSLSEVAVRGFDGGHQAVYAPGAVREGDVFSCTNRGLRVAARVPAPGRTVQRHIDAAERGGATIVVRTSKGGTVRVSCSG